MPDALSSVPSPQVFGRHDPFSPASSVDPVAIATGSPVQTLMSSMPTSNPSSVESVSLGTRIKNVALAILVAVRDRLVTFVNWAGANKVKVAIVVTSAVLATAYVFQKLHGEEINKKLGDLKQTEKKLATAEELLTDLTAEKGHLTQRLVDQETSFEALRQEFEAYKIQNPTKKSAEKPTETKPVETK